MQTMAASALMIGLAVFFALFMPSSFERASQRAEAWAVNFAAYRQAVNAYALEHKRAGRIAAEELELQEEFSPMPWDNLVIWEENELRCYVFAPGTPALFAALSRLLHNSPSIGWKRNGYLVNGSGSALPLPGVIENGDIVSVIIVDKAG